MSGASLLPSLKAGQATLIVTSEAKYPKVASQLLSHLTKKKKQNGAYLSIGKTYAKMQTSVKGADWSKVLFLDAASHALKQKEHPSENCVLLQGPTSLTEMGIYLTKAILKADVHFVVFDSLSSLAVYNDEKTVLRFTQFVVSKVKDAELIGIIVSNSLDEEKMIVRAAKDMVDTVVVI